MPGRPCGSALRRSAIDTPLRPRRLEYRCLPSISHAVAQVVEVRHRDFRQAHIFEFVVLLVFPFSECIALPAHSSARAPDPLTPAASHPRQCTSAETAAVGAAVARSSPSSRYIRIRPRRLRQAQPSYFRTKGTSPSVPSCPGWHTPARSEPAVSSRIFSRGPGC